MEIIKDGWDSYHDLVLPKNISDIQRDETRKAFYAGAAVLWTSILKHLDLSGEEEPTEKDFDILEGIQNEINAFGAELDKSFFNPTNQ